MTNLVHGVEYDRKFTGSHAYIIKKSQSSKIEKFLRDITVPIDVKYYNMIRDGDIDGFVTFPNVVNVMNDLRSTLGHHWFLYRRTLGWRFSSMQIQPSATWHCIRPETCSHSIWPIRFETSQKLTSCRPSFQTPCTTWRTARTSLQSTARQTCH